MKSDPAIPEHPGTYVRRSVLPRGMPVKRAAELLGVGRPALSNFLNGKSALSPEMAVRLEKAFGADRSLLAEIDAAFDRHKRSLAEREVTVRAFVPPFLAIKARQIEAWADSQLDARSHLAVLLRKLVHSTGNELRLVDFPGYDNAQRAGNDGVVDAGAATPWIPEGRSYWEFGTDQNPGRKAEGDYRARLGSLTRQERLRSTFVFVTPRNWAGKIAWEAQKKRAREWREVRAFDASDLEQWMEQSVHSQIWFSEQIALPTTGYRTLERAWSHWANASEPNLTSECFAPSISASKDVLRQWLDRPSEKPLVVSADSREEALAFLACLARADELRQFRDLSAVFDSPEALRTLIVSSVPFIPIVYSDDVAREIVPAFRRLHSIVIQPRNSVAAKPDIALDLLSYSDFEKALTSMSIGRDDIDRLARESGRSPTILRRRLSTIPSIRTPVWASDDATAKVLVPMMLVGAWHVDAAADRTIMSTLAERSHDVIEDEIARMLRSYDPPVWSLGGFRGVVSKLDALYAIAAMITKSDLDRFFVAAHSVLSEVDPALELPEESRWAAGLYGKQRDYSGALRDGICETLVFLSIHGNYLFHDRLGLDVETRVSLLVTTLLTPLTIEKLISQERELPRYAEAAPEAFLQLIEADLKRDDPVTMGLLKPVDSAAFWASPLRSELLWALECLAWKPANVGRVSVILARLSQRKIVDNWTNKPIASLHSIFRSWLPQTAASFEQRVKVLEVLAGQFGDIAWDICIKQVWVESQTGHYSYRPRWRSDASGYGRGVTNKERWEFAKKALDLMIAWPAHNEHTLGDLVGALQGVSEEYQARVWDLIDEWAHNAGESPRATLRERIRQVALTRRGKRRELGKETLDRARNAFEALRPTNSILRHRWLFVDQWIQESADEMLDDELNYEKREARIAALRRAAIGEIWAEHGTDGVQQLVADCGAAGTIGFSLAPCIAELEAQVEFVNSCVFYVGPVRTKLQWCLRGFVHAMEQSRRAAVLLAAGKDKTDEEWSQLFVCAPFDASTWRLLDGASEGRRRMYWETVMPGWGRHSLEEITELIDRLLEARRPRAAFHAVHLDIEDIETSRLKRLLHDIATVGDEPLEQYKVDGHSISEALESLDGRVGVSRDEMAQLEFWFIQALDHTKHGIPNLEKQVGASPTVFVQALAFAYRRSDGAEDPPELRIDNPHQRTAVATAAYQLLDRVCRIPGTSVDGSVDSRSLAEWLTEVRNLARIQGRAEVGDQRIGQLLAKSPGSDNGVWPCDAVCQAMEGIASPELATGFQTGVYNSRGVHSRGEGGEQERVLAAKYRGWALQLQYDYPFVGQTLEQLARTYDREAAKEDSEAMIRKRLLH